VTTVAVVPAKLNNRHLSGKNTTTLKDGSTLLSRILPTLGGVDRTDHTCVCCSDVSVRAVAESQGANFLQRDPRRDEDIATSWRHSCQLHGCDRC
jgi:CMP-N-acetylneuraminic acid synthetase